MGSYGTVVAVADPEDRAGVIAAIFTVGYLAFSVPAVIAGVATSHYGLHGTALVYAPVVAVLAATAAASLVVRRARARRAAVRAAAHQDPPPGPPAVRPDAGRTAPATCCSPGSSR